MKIFLQRKRTAAWWLGIILILWPMLAEGQGNSYDIYDDEDHISRIGTVEVELVQGVPQTVTLTAKIIRGFKINTLNLNTLVLNSWKLAQTEDDHNIYRCSVDASSYNSNTENGHAPKFKGAFSFSDIKDPRDLRGIFNYYAPNSTTLSVVEKNTLEVSQPVKGPGTNSSELRFVSGTILIHQMNKDSKISDFNIEVDGGDLTFQAEAETDCPKIIMKTGKLTLESVKPFSLTMEGGLLTLGGKKITQGTYYMINGLTAKGGSITYQKGPLACYINSLNIEGDVSLTGDNQLGGDIRDDLSTFLANQILIKSGTVNMKKIGLHKKGSLVINSGNLTLEDCALKNNTYNRLVKAPTSYIRQKDGTLLIKNCLFDKGEEPDENDSQHFIEIEKGILTIDKGYYLAGNKSFIYMKGVEAQVNIKSGNFGRIDNFAAVYQENGIADISGGSFWSPICTAGGTLNISNIYFPVENTTWEGIDANLHVLNAEAKVALSGGYYADKSVYVAPDVAVEPENLLADGYGFYTWNQEIQPDLQLTDVKSTVTLPEKSYKCFSFGQVKQIQSDPAPNDCLEAAQTADVGPEGTDVKVIELGKISQLPEYELEINTPKGLVWLATLSNRRKDQSLNNGKKYIDGASVIKLTADLDMSSYNWIPFQWGGRKFDGQGHCVSNLKVNQSEAAFMSSGPDTLANLIVSGEFKSIQTSYTHTAQYAAGLVIHNRGTILNCGVQQSTVSCQTTDGVDVLVGGLVAENRGSIQNCYMTGPVTCDVTHGDILLSPTTQINHKVGGIVGENWQHISNSYHAGGPVSHTSSADPIVNLTVEKDDIAVKPKFADQWLVENCSSDPVLDALNKPVRVHNAGVELGKILWFTWVISPTINQEYPIHEYPTNPTVFETQITLLTEGNGELVATYYVPGENPEDEPIKKTIQADTTLHIRNFGEFTVTATPGKGARLDKVTRQLGNQPEEPLEVKANESFSYDVSFLSTTLKAYFLPDVLEVNDDITLIGKTEEKIEVKQIEISKAGSEVTPALITLGNIKVGDESDPAAEATTKIDKDSHVIFQLSGTNDLGKIINKGNATLQAEEGMQIKVSEVTNAGVFVDETGWIQEVKAADGNLLLKVKEAENKESIEGNPVTLTASVEFGVGVYNFIFQWQKWNGHEWENIEEPKQETSDPVARSMTLRTSSLPIISNELKVVLNTAGTYPYRCRITQTDKSNVSTSLCVKMEVKVSPAGGTVEPDPDPSPDLPVSAFYTVVLPEVTGAKFFPNPGRYTVREKSSFSFTLALAAGYDQSVPVVKAGETLLTADAFGNYTIAEVTSDLTITVTGITPNPPTANAAVTAPVNVWSEGNTLHVYTSDRQTIRIYTFNGQLYKTSTGSGHCSFPSMPTGHYIVVVGQKIYKIFF